MTPQSLGFNADSVCCAFIMHQYSTIGNIIGMEALSLKVVYGYRSFKNFMLYLLNNDILFPYLSATGL